MKEAEYRKGGSKVWQAWLAYQKVTTSASPNVASFVAGWNAREDERWGQPRLPEPPADVI